MYKSFKRLSFFTHALRESKLPTVIILVGFLGVTLAGCGYYAVKGSPPAGNKASVVPFISRQDVMRGLIKNYGGFYGISGRLVISAEGKSFSFEEAGVYKYIKGKYAAFTIFDTYGDLLFNLKIYDKSRKALFFDPQKGKYRTIRFDEKYSGKMRNYKRLIGIFNIFLNVDSLSLIKKSTVFYDTESGFFFDVPPSKDKGPEYYICVGKDFLVKKITVVKNGRVEEKAVYGNYVKKGSSMFPLKISVDDYLYNVKIKVRLSKGSVPLWPFQIVKK